MQEVLAKHGLCLEIYTSQTAVPERIIDILVQNSRQDHIRATTPNDELMRFTNKNAFIEWFTQGKLLGVLVETNTQVVAGIAWFSEQTNPHAKQARHTYAHRLYEGFLGKGLSTPFAAAMHECAGEYIGTGPYWLTVLNSNTAAIRTYENIGYVTTHVLANRRIMIRNEEAK
jgi:RimJ/RimL family protein N-acetyltransferase